MPKKNENDYRQSFKAAKILKCLLIRALQKIVCMFGINYSTLTLDVKKSSRENYFLKRRKNSVKETE